MIRMTAVQSPGKTAPIVDNIDSIGLLSRRILPYLGPAIQPVYLGSRIGGTAVTAVCWPGDNLMIHAAVEHCQPGDVLVVTTTSGPSTWITTPTWRRNDADTCGPG